MRDFDGSGLEDFLHQADGESPPVFVGREDILKPIESHAETGWKGSGAPFHGMAKATTILHGAPGAGKSTILGELKNRSTSERAEARGQSRVVTFSSHDLLSDLPGVIELVGLAGGLPPDGWRRFSSRLALGIDFNVVRAEAAMSWTAAAAERPDSVLALAQRFPATKWQGPVIVAVDEVQRLPGGRHAPHALFLQAVHDGRSSLPLSLVLAGLGDAVATAAEMDLTRPSVMEVSALSVESDNDEAMELVLGFCGRFGVESSGCEDKLAELAAPCEGWPRHLHFACQALGRAVHAARGDLACVNWERVVRETAESRLRYYRRQRSPEMKEADVLTAHVMRNLKDGLSWSAVAGLIEDGIEDRAGCRLPKDMSPERFLRHLVHRGALHERTDDTLHCPIPSFRRHLVDAGGLYPLIT